MGGKIALVTGASKGIGRGIALSLAGAGYDLGINYNTDRDGAEATLESVRKLGGRALAFKADIQAIDEIRSMFAEFFNEFGHIDLLVNNAGITKMAPFLEIGREMFDSVINTDLRGTFFCSQEAARNMAEKGVRGVIINISSNHSRGCWPGSTVYAAAKAGVDKLTRNMALDLAVYGIRVAAIAPGYTDLERSFGKEYNKIVEKCSNGIPLKRFARTREIGEAVVYLASESAGYITGTTLFIDGGALLPVVAEHRLDYNIS